MFYQMISAAVLAVTLSSSAFALSSLPATSAEVLDDFSVSSLLNGPFLKTSDGKPCGLRVMSSRRNSEVKYLVIAVQGGGPVRNDLAVQIAPIMEDGRRINASSLLIELNRNFTVRERGTSVSFSYCTRFNGESIDCLAREAHTLKQLEINMDDIKISRVEFNAQGDAVSSLQVACVGSGARR